MYVLTFSVSGFPKTVKFFCTYNFILHWPSNSLECREQVQVFIFFINFYIRQRTSFFL